MGAVQVVPVPVSVEVLVAPETALVVTARFADRAPAVVGVKVTAIVQKAVGARASGQSLVCRQLVGFAPVREIDVIVRLAVPVEVSVKFCGAPEVP